MKANIGPYCSNLTRRVKVVVEDHDTWNLDVTLAYIILPLLKDFRENTFGAPVIANEDVPHLPKQHPPGHESVQMDLFNSDEQHDLFTQQYMVRWYWVLDEMIWAFEQVNTDWEEQYFRKNYSPVVEHLDFDIEGYERHRERMQNGFRLFGTYYHNLWN